MMKDAHDTHDNAHAHPDMELDAIDYPSSGPWDGQVLDLNPGAYKANWEFKKKTKGSTKGAKFARMPSLLPKIVKSQWLD